MLNLVLPKGSLETETLKLFAEADLPLRRKSDREYNATIDDPRIGQVKILRPQEIALYVEQGYFDLGITGHDWVEESGGQVAEIMELNYNKTGVGAPVKIVLAVAQESGITQPSELKPNIRVSTEYPNLTRRYFERLGLPVQIYTSYGATEAKVPEIVDAIVEITETGNTLIRHGMRIIDIVLQSTTRLVANQTSFADPAKRTAIEEIKTLLEGVLAGRGKCLIKLNVPEESLESVISMLPAMKAPTVSRLFNSNFYAVETVVVKSEINLLIPELKKRGAEDILEIPISKIVV